MTTLLGLVEVIRQRENIILLKAVLTNLLRDGDVRILAR